MAVAEAVQEKPKLLAEPPQRLHHHAYVVRDQEVNRQFFEDLLGIPLVATWCEKHHNTRLGREVPMCHTFFGHGRRRRAGVLLVRRPGGLQSGDRGEATSGRQLRPRGVQGVGPRPMMRSSIGCAAGRKIPRERPRLLQVGVCRRRRTG